MQGTPLIPFLALFADTIKTHGVAWAWAYYGKKGRMPRWEFRFWARVALLGG